MPGKGPSAGSFSLPRAVLLYAACAPLLIGLAAALWALRFPWISNSSGPEYEVMELFGFVAALAVVAVASYRLVRFRPASLEEAAPFLAFALLGTYFAAQTTEFLPPSPDWHAYVDGAKAVLQGQNPYEVRGFIYPPFAGQALATLYRAIAFGFSFLPRPEDPDFLWKGVYFVYQAMQFFLVLGACCLSYLFGRRAGLRSGPCALLIVALFIFNVPLLRTLHLQQVNLYLLDAMLIALLTTPRSALLGGIAVGVASQIKLYPLLLMAPAAVLREWRFILWTLAAIAAVVLIGTGWGTDLEPYRRFIEFAPSFPGGTAFRDNSIHSLVYNTARAFTGFGEVSGALAIAVRAACVLTAAAVVLYFAARVAARERASRAGAGAPAPPDARRFAHMTDAIAALMLLSPMVWEHHYVLMIPVAIWAIATAEKERLWSVATGTFLIFCIPIFDVYPLSYHRVAGLALILYSTQPRDLPWTLPRRRLAGSTVL